MKSTKCNEDKDTGEKPGVMRTCAQGTGLLVVKSIIDIIGGRLEFKVQPDKGTTVRIYLRKWEERK